MAEEFHYLTKTAIELHNDEKFISKRLKEQVAYMADLQLRYKLRKINTARYSELYFTAFFVWSELYDRLMVVMPGYFIALPLPDRKKINADLTRDFLNRKPEKKINIARWPCPRVLWIAEYFLEVHPWFFSKAIPFLRMIKKSVFIGESYIYRCVYGLKNISIIF